MDTQPSCKATSHEFLAPSVPHECISRYIPTGVFMYPVFNLQRKFAHLDANWTNFSQVWTFPHIKNRKPNSQSLQKTVFAQLWKKRGLQILCSQGDNCLRNMLLTVKEPVPNHASFWFSKVYWRTLQWLSVCLFCNLDGVSSWFAVSVVMFVCHTGEVGDCVTDCLNAGTMYVLLFSVNFFFSCFIHFSRAY